MEQAIKKAIKGGWKPEQLDFKRIDTAETAEESYRISYSKSLLDPLFWQSLGKAEGWGQRIYKTDTGEEWGKRICLHCGVDCNYQPQKESGCNHVHYPEACQECSKKAVTWKDYWHRFIDHIAEGKDVDSFFKALLPTNNKE